MESAKIQRGRPVCNSCFSYDKFIPIAITNADRIRSMSDEELAKSRVEVVACMVDGESIPGMYEYETSMGRRYSSRKQAEESELKWLQSEVEG